MKDKFTKTWIIENAVRICSRYKKGDAVEPAELRRMCKEAIEDVFDEDLYQELEDIRATERVEYQKQLKNFVKKMKL